MKNCRKYGAGFFETISVRFCAIVRTWNEWRGFTRLGSLAIFRLSAL